jgi:hypothetical protein
MGNITICKIDKVKVHVDEHDLILGVEIPDKIFNEHRVARYPTTINKEDNPKCPKGIKECVKEIMLPDVSFSLICNTAGSTLALEDVSLNADSLRESYRNFHQCAKSKSQCGQFVSIHSNYEHTPACIYCALLEVCNLDGARVNNYML